MNDLLLSGLLKGGIALLTNGLLTSNTTTVPTYSFSRYKVTARLNITNKPIGIISVIQIK